MAKEYVTLDGLSELAPGLPNWVIKDNDKGLVFVAGMVGINLDTLELVNGLESQIRLTLNNIKFLLSKVGCEMKDVVQMTMFFVNDPLLNSDVETDVGTFVKVKEEICPELCPVGIGSRVDSLMLSGALFELMVCATTS